MATKTIKLTKDDIKKPSGKAKVKFSDGTYGEIDPVDDVYDNTGSRQQPSAKRAVAEKPALKKTTQNTAGTRVSSGGGESTSGTTPKTSSQTGGASGKKAAPKMPQMTAADASKLGGDFGAQINAPRARAQEDLSRLIGTTTNYDATAGSRKAAGVIGAQKGQIQRTDVNAGARQGDAVLSNLMRSIGMQGTTPQLVQAYDKIMGYAKDLRGQNLAGEFDPMIQKLMGLSEQTLADPRIKDAIYNLQKRGVQIDPNQVNAELLKELASQREYTGKVARTDTGFGPKWAKESADLIRSQVGREGVEARNKLAARLTGQGLGGGVANNAMRLLQREISTAVAEGAKKAALEGEAGRQTGILAKMKLELEARGLSAGTAQNIAANSINALKAGADVDTAALSALLNQNATAADIMKAAAGLVSNKANVKLGQAQTVAGMYGQGAGVAGNIASERSAKNQLLAGLGGQRANVLAGMDKNTIAKLNMLASLTGEEAGAYRGMDTLGMQKMGLLGNLQGASADLANQMSGGIQAGFGVAQNLFNNAMEGYKTQAGLYGQAMTADAINSLLNPAPVAGAVQPTAPAGTRRRSPARPGSGSAHPTRPGVPVVSRISASPPAAISSGFSPYPMPRSTTVVNPSRTIASAAPTPRTNAGWGTWLADVFGQGVNNPTIAKLLFR